MKKTKLLYYLDDDSDDLIFFKNAAVSLNQQVSLFSNGHDLFQSLRFTDKKPDIIFLDLHMPIMNGEEILHRIKHSDDFKDIPIVMLSTAYPKKMVHYLLDNGANYLMKKPSTHKDLNAVLAEVLEIDWNKYKASA